MTDKNSRLRIVGGTDLSKRDHVDGVNVRRIDELLAAENLDLDALARELGQFGPDRDESERPAVPDSENARPPSLIMAQKQPGQVSFMITNAQKEQLRLRGYDENTIRALTPAEAHDILRSGGD